MNAFAKEVASRNIVDFMDTDNAEEVLTQNPDLQDVMLKAYRATDATHKIIASTNKVIDSTAWISSVQAMLPDEIISMYQ